MSAVAEPIFAGRFDQAVCWRGAVFPVGRLDAIRGRGGGRRVPAGGAEGTNAGGRRTRAPVGQTPALNSETLSLEPPHTMASGRIERCALLPT